MMGDVETYTKEQKNNTRFFKARSRVLLLTVTLIKKSPSPFISLYINQKIIYNCQTLVPSWIYTLDFQVK